MIYTLITVGWAVLVAILLYKLQIANRPLYFHIRDYALANNIPLFNLFLALYKLNLTNDELLDTTYRSMPDQDKDLFNRVRMYILLHDDEKSMQDVFSEMKRRGMITEEFIRMERKTHSSLSVGWI